MEHFKEFMGYAPVIIVILMFIWQNKVFVRPEQLEKKNMEIIKKFQPK